MEIVPALFSVSFLPYFIQKATIKGAQILYNNEAFGFNWDVDLSLLLDIHRKNGSTYEYQLNIRGIFKRDDSGKITGWGSCFKLQKLFQCLKINGVVNSDGTITQNSLDALINKEVCVLSYLNGLKDDGNNRYQLWDILSNDRLALEQDFQSSVDKGYPKNYHPELMFIENKTQVSNAESASDDLEDFDF